MRTTKRQDRRSATPCLCGCAGLTGNTRRTAIHIIRMERSKSAKKDGTSSEGVGFVADALALRFFKHRGASS